MSAIDERDSHAGNNTSRAPTLADDASTNSKHDYNSVSDDPIEDAFEPPQDEESASDGNHGQNANEKQEETNIVDWDGPDDPENPQNWPLPKKLWITAICGMMTFVVSFGSSVFSTATNVTAREFGVSSEVMILGVTLYVVGFAVGPLAFGPLSELYGRQRPLMAALFCFLIFQIPVAVAPNLATLFICRFLSGAFGSAPLAIVAGMYVDFWPNTQRGYATLLYAGAVFAGPTVGPIVGEFTVKNESLGWRWTAWFTMIMGSFFYLLALPTVPETLHTVLLTRKAARQRIATRNWALHSKAEEMASELPALLRKYGLKPMQMIYREPILIAMTAYMSLVYGILYLIFFALPYSYQLDRGWTLGVASLPFIGIFIGVVLACAMMSLEMRLRFNPKMLKAQKLLPEERLPNMIAGSIILVIGLFWFAWTSFPTISWVPQVISGIFVGCGIIMVFMPAIIYLVDVYLFDANSAIAANTFVRSFIAAAFPMFATSLYEGLGVQWATSVLAFACLALTPAPILFYVYGKRIRGWSTYAYDLG
ncbi:hypothetical protein MBLNU230_g1484t1 [Neophaeotheca triangularis]